MKVRKILCPVDFSDGSEHALELAVRLAGEHEAELVVAHAWHLPPLTMEYSLAPATLDLIQRDAAQGLDHAVERARGYGARNVRPLLLEGLPWHRITEAAAGFDLIVMGTHGRTGLRHVLLGSVAEKVVRHAHCSVLVVPSKGVLHTFKRVVVPVDFSESSRTAMLHAKELVRDGGKLTLIHVIELPVTYRGQIPIDLADQLDGQARKKLVDWASEAGNRVPVAQVVRTGSPGAQVLHVIDEDPCDLVVVGSHGRTGIKRALLGSVAEKIVRHAGCPVLVAR
jgi:nucleotide-binding universal stress UspA family protein